MLFRSLLGVAMGSAQPPCLVVLRYRPAQDSGKAHLGLVGKGVTFDTGGISIKPADGMEKMKYDMAGGATMIGAMQALAQLKPSIPVTATSRWFCIAAVSSARISYGARRASSHREPDEPPESVASGA